MARTWVLLKPVDGTGVGEEVDEDVGEEVLLDEGSAVLDGDEDEIVVMREVGADDAVIVLLLLL